MRRGALALALALALGGCSLVLDFSDPLVDGGAGNGNGGATDATVDADPLAPDAGPDPRTIFEPNNTFDQATVLAPGGYGPVAVFPAGDHDFYRFTLDAAADVVIEIQFKQTEGDLDMKLHDGSRVQIGTSAGFMDNEKITRTSAMGGQLGPGEYYVEVYGYNNTYVNERYTLVITVM